MYRIVGIASTDKKNHTPIVSKMAHQINGGECGTSTFERCALGQSRLSVIDLFRGKEPMKSPVSGATIVFDGEIYGYKDIKKTLSDYPFSSDSGAEVILALYDKYDTNMPPHLPGAFSFAIWDDNKQRLFCSRDRFGEKPFFYAIGENNELIFASEIKSILASGLVKPKLSTDSMVHMLRFYYVHPLKTIYENIYTLPPAHNLIYENGRISVERYWDLPSVNEQMSYSDAVEGFRYYFEQSIKKTIAADVPVGVFLSGGLDSSTITIEAVKHIPNIPTVAFGYVDSPKNELPYARAVADLCKTNHHELTDTRNDLADLFVLMSKLHDEPFNDMSQIPLYLISQYARQYFNVVLDGTGADGSLCGDSLHWSIIEESHNSSIKRKIKEFTLCNAYHVTKLFGIQWPKLENFYNYCNSKHSIGHLMIHLHKGTPTDVIRKLAKFEVDDIFDEQLTFTPTGTIEDTIRSDATRYLPGDVLAKGDRITTATGLEIRMPFLEKDLAEFILSMPVRHKYNGEVGKLPMRDVYGSQWPEMLNNRPKQGFGVPYDLWYERQDFTDLRNDVFLNKNSRIYDYLDYDEVIAISKSHHNIMWNTLHLALWLENHK